MSSSFDVDAYTKPFQLTKGLHRKVYPSIDPANPDLRASGKVVMVTGAGGSLGCDIAKAWAIAGASSIILIGRTLSSLQETAKVLESIDSKIKVRIQSTNVTSEAAVQELFDSVLEEHPKIDVLINNAGALNNANISSTDPAKWWNDFEVNVKGPFLMIHHFTKHFSEGFIINLNTTATALNAPGLSSYLGSKIAMMKVAECLELEHPKLRIFSIAPGLVKSAMLLDQFAAFAIDEGMMTGGLSLYLASSRAKNMSSGFYSVNWDLNEMEQHQDEIIEGNLLKLSFLHAELGPEGQQWKS
ncbi:hypothetical protein MMC28_010423 [Mycoblastus sanguinarius]|nr:hypothetical protein [Mycoblastus sanguinarius]